MPATDGRQLPPALPSLGRSATIASIIQYQNHFRASGNDVLLADYWRQLREPTKDIATTAQRHHLADEVLVVHCVIRIAANLNEDPRRYAPMLRQALTTFSEGCTKPRCLWPRHCCRPGPVTNFLQCQRNLIKMVDRQGLDPQAKPTETLHILPWGAAAPSQDEIRLQGHHPLEI